MKEKLSIEIKLDVIYSKDDDKYTVLNTNTEIVGRFPIEENDWIDKIFTKGEIQYGYISFNSNKDYIGNLITPGQDIKVIFIKDNKEIYNLDLNVHSKARRIDKITKVYSNEDIKVGDTASVRYIEDKKTLEVKLR